MSGSSLVHMVLGPVAALATASSVAVADVDLAPWRRGEERILVGPVAEQCVSDNPKVVRVWSLPGLGLRAKALDLGQATLLTSDPVGPYMKIVVEPSLGQPSRETGAPPATPAVSKPAAIPLSMRPDERPKCPLAPSGRPAFDDENAWDGLGPKRTRSGTARERISRIVVGPDENESDVDRDARFASPVRATTDHGTSSRTGMGLAR